MTLGTVLGFVALLSLLAFTVAGLCVAQFNFSVRADNRDAALELAKNVVRLGLSSVAGNPDFGKAGQTLELSGTELNYGDGFRGLLTFDESRATQEQVPRSRNLFGAAASQAASAGTRAQVVPADCVHLVGVGFAPGGARATFEAVLHRPAFPYALAANGELVAEGGVTVAGLSELPAPEASPELTLAELRCNSNQSEAVRLGKNTQVHGDVVAVGQIECAVTPQLGNQAPADPKEAVWIRGQLKTGAERQELLEVSLTDYDPHESGTALAQETVNGPLVVPGDARRRQGNLVCEQGLTLEGGVLYVEGNLTVHGGIQGRGRVVCTGNVTLEGNTRLDAGNGVALLAGGSIALTGSGQAGSYFQGLLYTNAGLTLDKVTCVGPVVSRGEAPVTLREATLLLPDAVAATGELVAGGAGGGGQNGSSLTVYKAGGVAQDPPTAAWDRAEVFRHHLNAAGAVYYTRTVFTKTGATVSQSGDLQEITVAALQNALRGSGFTQADLDEKPVTAPGNPPLPPADPAAGRPGFSVDPSQFFRISERLRVLYRQPQ